MTTEVKRDAKVMVCPLEELEREAVKVFVVEGRSIAVFYDQGNVYATDNRCPHTGWTWMRM